MSIGRQVPDTYDVAARWFLRSRGAGWSARDAAELEFWLAADPQHRACFDDVAQSWQASGEAAGTPAVAVIRTQALAARPARIRPAPWTQIAAAAAIVVVLAGASLGGLKLLEPQPEVQIYRTGVGERATIALADGSTATLNTASALAVEYTKTRRGLRLVSGEAWFDVAKNPKRPFVVAAGDHAVTATGTSFDVRLDADRLRVAVTEGRVLVASDEDRSTLAAVSAGQRAEVRGREVLMAQAGPISGDWRRGQLRFDSASLGEATIEMNRYRKVPIIVDPAAANLRVSGVFMAGENSSFAEALPLSHPVLVTSTPEAIRITRKPGK